jgi:hypothetical protein
LANLTSAVAPDPSYLTIAYISRVCRWAGIFYKMMGKVKLEIDNRVDLKFLRI